ASEIGDVGAEWMLATKATTCQLPATQTCPEVALRRCHIASELAREADFGVVAHGALVVGVSEGQFARLGSVAAEGWVSGACGRASAGDESAPIRPVGHLPPLHGGRKRPDSS